jgi:uncharacterized protein YecT (DUF1311 family)
MLVLLAGAPAERTPHDETQAGMSEEAARGVGAADKEMAAVLKSLGSMPGVTPEAVAKLKRAQAAWEAYRDAQVSAKWPFPDAGLYGSVLAMCVADERAELTKQRVAQLRAMLKPEEGDVCGSRWPE